MGGPLTLAVWDSMRRSGYVVAASVLQLWSCEAKGPEVDIDSIEPASANVAQLPVPVTIHGAYFLGARVSLDDRAPAGVLQPQALIGGEPLTGVRVVAPDTLTGFVPATLPAGTYDVEVLLGDDRRGTLEDAFVVLDNGATPVGSDDTPPPVLNGCNAGELGVPELVWPNAVTNDRGPALSADRLKMVFSRIGAEREDLYYATRPSLDAAFGEPSVFDEFSGGRNTTPVLSGDELKIYFASERSGNWDIWVADRLAVGLTFGNLRQLMALNSTASELRPWISADGLTIYFESDRTGTGSDVWKATRASTDAEFSAPQQVTWLNTPSNEQSASTTPDQLTCFYVSDSFQAVGWKTLLRTQRAAATDSFSWGVAVSALSGHNVNGYASLSPDGRELVFSAAGPTQQIWRVLINCTP